MFVSTYFWQKTIMAAIIIAQLVCELFISNSLRRHHIVVALTTTPKICSKLQSYLKKGFSNLNCWALRWLCTLYVNQYERHLIVNKSHFVHPSRFEIRYGWYWQHSRHIWYLIRSKAYDLPLFSRLTSHRIINMQTQARCSLCYPVLSRIKSGLGQGYSELWENHWKPTSDWPNMIVCTSACSMILLA